MPAIIQAPLSAPLAFTAELILAQHPPPDLSHITLLLPQRYPARALRQQLLKQAQQAGHQALLLPAISTLPDYLALYYQSPKPLISAESRLLLLVEALKAHPEMFATGSPWLLAENLLELFDELTLHHVTLPERVEDFAKHLATAYQLAADHPILLREARIVHILWQAWQQQLAAENLIDPPAYYLQQLAGSLTHIPQNHRIYMIGFQHLLPAEQSWAASLMAQQQLQVVIVGQTESEQFTPCANLSGHYPHDDSTVQQQGFKAFLDYCFAHQAAPLLERAQQLGQQQPTSPALPRLSILGLNALEQEVQAVSLFVRLALSQNAKSIGIITEDRRLARRLRALLERSGIALYDSAGWALSTTRAGSVLDNWLQCIEGDFPYQAFLDLLKSPALGNLLADTKDKDPLSLVYRLEQDVILHENIASGLQRYRLALELRAQRLGWKNQTQSRLRSLLKRFENAGLPLQKLYQHGLASTSTWLKQLRLSLQALHISDFLQDDPAGEQVLALLDNMQSTKIHIQLSWTEFRTWLGRQLEQHYFIPPVARHGVQLLNLAQSQLQQFDALVIAGADQQHLPGHPDALPFFNDAVRLALGLPDWRQRLYARQYLFRSLLENSQETLITWQQNNKGEPVAACPWVEAMEHFHKSAYGQSLQHDTLRELLNNAALVPALTDNNVLVTPAQCPQPQVESDAIPQTLTVSAHQRLIDCPYRFYVSDILKLKPPDDIREALQKSDYGSRVHLCLQAFHFGAPPLAGPFSGEISQDNRAEAIAQLTDIAHQVFNRDIEDNFQHRGWLQRWLAVIPVYIDWQIKHNALWHITSAEESYDVKLSEQISLRGRIDRIEQHTENQVVNLVDYKTGNVPSLSDVLNGEEVQLLSYSLLYNNAHSVQYLGLDDNKRINDRTQVEHDTLATLSAAVQTRLVEIIERLHNTAAMPALGDEQSCRYCDAAGICRRQAWSR